MGLFTNQYEDAISEIKWSDRFNFTNESIAYEIGLMKDYKRKLEKIMRILDKYDDIFDELQTNYNNASIDFDDGIRIVDKKQGEMSGEVSSYVHSFDEKIDEIQKKYAKKKTEMDQDKAMITKSIAALKERKKELHKKFYIQYDICKEKLNKE